MKNYLLLFSLCFASLCNAAQQTIENTDLLKAGTVKINANFTELYARPNPTTWTGSTNVVTLGTVTIGTWQGSIIAPAFLGTGSSITTKFLRGDGTWQTVATGSGDVVGPGSATDNAIVRFDSTTGKLIQNSVVTIDDTGAVAGVTTLASSGRFTFSGDLLYVAGAGAAPPTFVYGLFPYTGVGLGIASATGMVGFTTGDGTEFVRLTTTGIILGSSGPKWTSGSGSPESAVSAPVGSFYSRTDGGANTSFYVKESGSGNTGWVAK